MFTAEFCAKPAKFSKLSESHTWNVAFDRRDRETTFPTNRLPKYTLDIFAIVLFKVPCARNKRRRKL